MSDPISRMKSSSGDVDAAIFDERSMDYVKRSLLDGHITDVNTFVKAQSYEDKLHESTFYGWAYPFTKEFVRHDRIECIHIRYSLNVAKSVRVGFLNKDKSEIVGKTVTKAKAGVFDEYWHIPVLVNDLPDVFYVFITVVDGADGDRLQVSSAVLDKTYVALSSKYNPYYKSSIMGTDWVNTSEMIGNASPFYRPVIGLSCIDNAVSSMMRPIKLVFSGNHPGWFIAPSGKWKHLPDYPNFQMSDPVPIDGYRRVTVFTDWPKYNDAVARIVFSTSDAAPTSPNQDAYALAIATQEHAGAIMLDVPEGAKFMYVSADVSVSGTTPTTWPRAAEVIDADFVIDFYNDFYNDWLDNLDLVHVHLPNEYRLVVGDTFELFWKGVIEAFNPYARDIVCECDKGNCFTRKFAFTPASTGDYPLSVSVKNDNGKVLGTASTTLKVSGKASSPSSVKRVLCVGDSLTAPGKWPHELNRRLTGTGGTPVADGLSNIEFIGTQKHDGTAYEGYGGWTFNSYNSSMQSSAYVWITCVHDKTAADQHSTYKDANGAIWKIETIETSRLKMIRQSGTTAMPASGKLTYVSNGEHTDDIVFTASQTAAGNPFWDDSKGKVDFAGYARRIGASSIDYCYVMLGWNSTGYSETVYKSQVRTFIDNLRASFPNCVIVLMGIQVPSLDGFGTNYGCGWNYMDKLRVVHKFDQWYADVAAEYSNVYTISIVGQFDAEYGYPTLTVPVNTRSAATEARQSNGVHPSDDGYMQIADAAYRDLTYRLQ